ncbi:uncharacterized protein [Typha latifolia]|uniref:uncharacterized protein n=1 Tax=Typha latifolia TaxID=4733 RepID=UPI003C2AD6AD
MAASSSDCTDGPVQSVISKRLRALRKKQNRILQMEESLAGGKILNKEQEDVLRSKPFVAALIDELEKLRLPLAAALAEEVSPPPPPPKHEEKRAEGSVEDLVSLLYFGSLFDVMPQREFTATMLTRTHERECCLTYDYVTDDSTDLLGEGDLDGIAALSALVTSRPVSSGVSHKSALQGSVEHARLWIIGADQPIHPGSSMTYAGLREKLKKILASDFFTTVPEMKAPVDVAAAVGKYGDAPAQVEVSEATVLQSLAVQTEGDAEQYEQKNELENFQVSEVNLHHQSTSIEETPKMDETDMPAPFDDASTQKEQQKLEEDLEAQNQGDADLRDEQYIPRRSYQNQRGGNRGGGRRGYPNGRGGRGGRGGGGGVYQNGRSQYYDPGYYPRSYNNTRGRGGRFGGGSAMYNNQTGPHGGHDPASVELGANA